MSFALQGKMPASVQSLIPAPLTGIPFQKASHFQLGFDHRPQGSVVESPFRTDFPPLWGNYKSNPILPPSSKGVLNQDMDETRETLSETCRAFPVKPLEPKLQICPPESHLQMHADSQIKILTPTSRDNYPWPDVTLQAPTSTRADYNKKEDHFPCGDKDKLKLLPSVYQFSYPAHEIHQPVVRAPCRHLGGVPTIKGDKCSYYGTSYREQFEGGWIPPVKSCVQNKSSIVFGDPRSSVSTSEGKRAYTVPDTRNRRVYDKERAASQVYKTNVKPGDGHTRFGTVTLESFPLREPAPVKILGASKKASSVLRGDEDPGRNRERANATTNRFFHTPMDVGAGPPQPEVPPWRLRNNVSLGDKHLNACFFSTTQHSDYQPPPESRSQTSSSKSHFQSHLPFNYPTGEGAVTTTQAMLVPHRQRTLRPSEESLQQVKHSHLILPWKGQRFFGTEQQEQFTPKYSGPVTICGGSFQVSSVPLGTLKKYSAQRRVVFAT
ncbi:stabilizer of axonemal microtubules 5 isoform X1 [Pelodiscus sinensis]|uniref:stabilizer of axonemal microtubules 5 isoform X1 n=2 Tax=Pelodiscus sinensis TaxID=13735 RepID=UPI003F6A95AF